MIKFAATLLLLGCVLFAACERTDTDPLSQRKLHLLIEENARLAGAVASIDGALAKPPPDSRSVSDLPSLAAENDRLREILGRHERGKALKTNKAQREAIERQVAEIRGLDFKAPVDYAVLNRQEIKQTISAKLAEVFSEQEFKDMTAAMAAIGLLPAGYPLREKYVSLLGEQVAAFYDQHAHKLFMYEDAALDNAQNQIVLAHELTHALQDQHFGLKRLPLEIKTNDDRAAAASALVEGDATLVMSEFMLKNLSLKSLKENLTASLGQDMKQLETAPRFLREMLVFPYLRGQEFCAALMGHGGYEAVSRAYEDPPGSTAQILHPEKYLAKPREEPIAIEWASVELEGGKPVADNTVGEMGMRVLFTEWIDAPTAEKASAGWRGDRYVYFTRGDVLVWKTVWATEQDAMEFFSAERNLLEKRHTPAQAGGSQVTYEMDAPRLVRLKRSGDRAVLLIDAADAAAGRAALEKFQ